MNCFQLFTKKKIAHSNPKSIISFGNSAISGYQNENEKDKVSLLLQKRNKKLLLLFEEIYSIYDQDNH